MKKLMTLLLAAGMMMFASAADECTTFTNVYDLVMKVQVPRIYDNNASKGYRKYQTQKITGKLLMIYDCTEESRPRIVVTDLVNKTHKINGECITYKCEVDDEGYMGPMTRVNLIGDNCKNKFETPSVVFYMDAEPDYNVGEDDEDNSLLITLAGKGSTKTWSKYIEGSRVISSVSGYLAGTLGCGCRAYGHVSPTRVAGPIGPTDNVDDVASVYGSWQAKFNSKLSPKLVRVKLSCGSYRYYIQY